MACLIKVERGRQLLTRFTLFLLVPIAAINGDEFIATANHAGVRPLQMPPAFLLPPFDQGAVGRNSMAGTVGTGVCRRGGLRKVSLRSKGEPVSDEIEELHRRIEERQKQLRQEREEARKRKEERRQVQLQGLTKSKSSTPRPGNRIVAPQELEMLDRSRELWSSLPTHLRSSLEMCSVIGQGSFGMVLKARVLRVSDGTVNGLAGVSEGETHVAVKLMKSRKGEEPILMREGLVLSLIDSPHVPRASTFLVLGSERDWLCAVPRLWSQ
eukprot:754933-Hanusia_phi.AAC.10